VSVGPLASLLFVFDVLLPLLCIFFFYI